MVRVCVVAMARPAGVVMHEELCEVPPGVCLSTCRDSGGAEWRSSLNGQLRPSDGSAAAPAEGISMRLSRSAHRSLRVDVSERPSTGSKELEMGCLSEDLKAGGSVNGHREHSLPDAAPLTAGAILRAQLNMEPRPGIGRQSAWSATGAGIVLTTQTVLPVPSSFSAGSLRAYTPPHVQAGLLRSSNGGASKARMENDLAMVGFAVPTAAGAEHFERLHRLRPGHR